MNLMAAVLTLQSDDHRKDPHAAAARQRVIDALCDTAPALAQRLAPDDGTHQPVPLTVSGVQQHPERGLYLRVTALDDSICQALCEWLNHLPDSLHLDDATYQITGQTTRDDTFGAASTRYEALLRDSLATPPVRRLKLHFLTPTVFRQGRFDTPLPDPFLVFQSLANRWAFFTQTQLPLELDFIREAVYISYHNIRTRRYHEPTHSTGFVGHVEFRSSPAHRLPSSLRRTYQHHQHMLHTLAQYARYAGVGSRTTFGCGQVRVNMD